jgi:hypothetical protein
MAAPNNRTAGPRANQNYEFLGNKKVMSLGTLIMAFVAKPLAQLRNPASTNGNAPKFEEVQVIFYNFNNKASVMSRCNIAQFPVQTKYFVREYARLRMESVSRAVNLSVREFMTFIATKIVDDVMNPAYKISDLYKSNEEELTVANQRTFDNQMLERMTRYNVGRHPDFVMPQISFEIEALPFARTNSTENIGTILRIHIYDQANSANTPLRELLALGTNNFMNSFSSYPGDPATARATLDNTSAADQTALIQNWRELHNRVVQQASTGPNPLIRIINPNNQNNRQNNNTAETYQYQNGDQYQFIGGPQRLKEYVMKNVPHIIYGAMGTNVRSAQMSSHSDSLLSTINMQRSLNADPVLPNGAQAGGMPLSLYPLELSVTSVGCTLLKNRGQEIFIDFNTNTSADNIYVVNGYQHKVEAGTFETTIKLIAQDGFGQYRNMIQNLNNASNSIQNVLNTFTPNQTPTTPTPPSRRPNRR